MLNVSNTETGQDNEPTQNLTFWQVLGSTLAAAFGVQSSKNRQRDFTHGKASHFILMGIGILFLVPEFYPVSIGDFWPIVLIVIGVYERYEVGIVRIPCDHVLQSIAVQIGRG